MSIDAIGVTTTNMQKTADFYTLLGFDFSQANLSEGHVEPIISSNAVRLMIDSIEIVKEIIGDDPKPSNHSVFALKYDSPEEVNTIASKVLSAGFKVVKAPWDAFWHQRYAGVEDPDGYKVDLFADL